MDDENRLWFIRHWTNE